MKLRAKIFIYFIIIAGSSSLISVFYGIRSISSRYEKTAREEIITLRERTEGMFHETLGELSRKGLFLSELSEIEENMKNPEEISTTLVVKSFFLTSINLKILDKSNKLVITRNNADTSFFNKDNLRQIPFLETKGISFKREAGIVFINGQICMISISPIIDQDTFENIGRLVLEMPLNSEFADQIREKANTEIVILSNSKQIGTTFLDTNGERYFPDLQHYKKNLTSYYNFLGDNYLLEQFVIKGFDGSEIGKVVVCQNVNDIILAKRIDIRGLILVFITVFLLVIIISYILGKNLLKPISVLSQSAEKISKGEFNIQIDTASKDEIGELSNLFNDMVSSLKSQRENMNRMRHYLKNIIDSMPSVLVGVNEQGEVTEWNIEAEKKTGIPAEKARGSNIEDIFPHFSGQIEKFRQSILEKTPQKMEKVMAKVADEIEYTDIIIYPLISNGAVGAVIRMDDVTTRVRIEDMMIQTEKMMSVGGLAAGMAHEINNPLGGILLGTQNILRRLSPDFSANHEIARECGIDMKKLNHYLDKRKILGFLKTIQQSGERAAEIVTNMLSFSRRSPSSLAPASLATIIDKTIDLAANDYDLKKNYDFKQIEIVREYEPDMPEVNCVESGIQQVILNLLKNSVQAMMEIKTRKKKPKIYLRLHRENNLAVLEVEDNGPGLDSYTKRRVFEPFFTTKEIGVGTGLGLSVSYFIITNNHKGTMLVESPAGKGAKFIIKLPLNLENK